MLIKVYGASQSLTKNETKYLVSWLGQKLLSKKHLQEVALNIVFKKDMTSKTGNIGEMVDITFPGYPPTKFRLSIERDIFHRRRTIATIAHEMVHVKQLMKGEISSSFLPHSWKGPKNFKTGNSEEYYDLPWEIEAYGREELLTVQYLDHVKKEKLKFAD